MIGLCRNASDGICCCLYSCSSPRVPHLHPGTPVMADAAVLAIPPPSAADALRQAALQSRLRNKRKRSETSEPVTPNTLPARTPDNVMTLNYDDEPAEPIALAVAVVAPVESSSDSARSATADDEDSLEREDGEISEADIDSSSLPVTSNAPQPTAAEIERSLLLTPNHPPRPYQSAAQPAHENGLRPKLRSESTRPLTASPEIRR